MASIVLLTYAGLALAVFLIGVFVGKTWGWVFVNRIPREWSIAIYAGRSFDSLQPLQGAAAPVLSRKDVTDVPAAFVADPFMVRHKDLWHIFFEIWNKRTGKGEIGHATSLDGLRWSYGGVVLDEPFHLSYPYVFEDQGQFYMIPETGDSYSIRLYRAEEFPRRWSLVKILVYGKYFDASVFRYKGKWWLYAGSGSHDTLHLFSSPELTGPWLEHPRSPVVEKNGHIARPAGRVLEVDGRIVRFAQDCDPAYGARVWAYEVTELNDTTYCERKLTDSPFLEDSGCGWNARGMHTVDLHERTDGGGWLACVDGCKPGLQFGRRSR